MIRRASPSQRSPFPRDSPALRSPKNLLCALGVEHWQNGKKVTSASGSSQDPDYPPRLSDHDLRALESKQVLAFVALESGHLD